jgi:hypothetical protein
MNNTNAISTNSAQKNGITPRNTVDMGTSLATPLIIFRFIPIGGEINPASIDITPQHAKPDRIKS